MSALFAMDIIHLYIFQCHPPDTTVHWLQEVFHTGVATPELVTFDVETHYCNPHPWPCNGICVSSSSNDS